MREGVEDLDFRDAVFVDRSFQLVEIASDEGEDTVGGDYREEARLRMAQPQHEAVAQRVAPLAAIDQP